MMLKLKLQYFGHLMWRADSFEKTLILGKIASRRRRGWQRMRWLDGITDTVDMGLGGFRQLVMDREAWRTAVHGVTESDTTEWLDWTELNNCSCKTVSKLGIKENFLFFEKCVSNKTIPSIVEICTFIVLYTIHNPIHYIPNPIYNKFYF